MWIGDDVMILKNVTIPNNTVIGAKSLITKSFTEENTLISGITAEVKKHNVYWRE